MVGVGGHSDVLIFVEDPGAAQCVVDLPVALAERGLSCQVWAAGLAKTWMAQRGKLFEVWPEGNALSIPDFALLVVGTADNPRTPGFALIDEARRRGRPSVGIVDASMNAGQRFRGLNASPLAHVPDWVLVPDAEAAATFVSQGFSAERVVACGHPHFDFVRQVGERLAQEGSDAIRRRVYPKVGQGVQVALYICEGAAGTEKGQMAYTVPSCRDGRKLGRTEAGLEMFLEAISRLSTRPVMVVRPHPKDNPGQYGSWLKEIDDVSAVAPPLEAVFAADVVAGQTSMLLSEAALLNRPTVSLLPKLDEAAWLPSARAGATTVVSTPEEAALAMRMALVDRPDRVIFDPPKGALGRMADILHRLAAGG